MKEKASPLGMDCRVWNGVEIQRRPTDGFVNATAMCHAGGKRWPDYVRLDRTQAYIAALAAVVQIPTTGPEGLIQTIQGGLPHLQGTWVHPRIAIDLARWLHPEFAVMMDGWFLEDFAPKMAAATPALKVLPEAPRQKLAYEVGGPGVMLPGFAAVSEQLTALLDDYVTKAEAEQRALPLPQQSRSLQQPRYVAKHFMEWLVAEHGQLVISPVPVGIPLTAQAIAAPPRPPAPPVPAPLPPRDHQGLARQQQCSPGQLLTAPDLARLLGIEPSTLNQWAAAREIGAERDGWRLIGRGKLSARRSCSTYPPGCASWLFQKV